MEVILIQIAVTTAKSILIHATYPSPVGATTTYTWTTNNNTNITMSGTWNITVQT